LRIARSGTHTDSKIRKGRNMRSQSQATSVKGGRVKLNDYRPVPLKGLRVGTFVRFNLYMEKHERLGGKGPDGFLLYHKRNLPMREHHVQRLIDSGVRQLFISTADQKDYLRYTEGNLQPILQDEKIGVEDKATMVYEVANGLAKDIVANPADPETIRRSKTFLENTMSFIVKQTAVVQTFSAIMSRDYSTYTHSTNVSLYALMLGHRLGLSVDALGQLGLGALFHDVGKARINKKVLHKKGPLTAQEWDVVKLHPVFAIDTLRKVPRLSEGVYSVVLDHHEKCDGSGYPRGLRDDQIHLHAKIACLVDVFDALTTKRSYKDRVTTYEALKLMRDEMAGAFDQTLWRQFSILMDM